MTRSAASAGAFPVFCIRKVYVSVPFSDTGTGLIDFVILSAGASATAIDALAVRSVVPTPLIVAVLFIEEPAASGAKLFAVVSYTIVAFPFAGTDIPVTVRGCVTVTAGVVCNTPFV